MQRPEGSGQLIFWLGEPRTRAKHHAKTEQAVASPGCSGTLDLFRFPPIVMTQPSSALACPASRRHRRDRWLIAGVLLLGVGYPQGSMALPPPDEVPEEVLRTEVILDARSPIDGKPMTPAEYAVFQAEEEAPFRPPNQVSEKARETIGLLKLRKFIRRYVPVIPIK